MSTTAVTPITIGPGLFTIGADTDLTNFSHQCTSLKVVPSVTKGDPINVLSGGQAPGDRSETFAIEGTLLQDFGRDNSTTRWLFDHRGEDHVFSYFPNNANGGEITGLLTVEAIDIGGEVKTKPTSDFTFTLIGPPVLPADTIPDDAL